MKIENLNLCLIGLVSDGKRTAAIAKLRCYFSRELIVIGYAIGADPWQTLADLLQDIKPTKADEIIIYTNTPLSCKVGSVPSIETAWKRGGKAGWNLHIVRMGDFDTLRDAARLAALRLLFYYDRYRIVTVSADKLQSTAELLQKGYLLDEYSY